MQALRAALDRRLAELNAIPADRLRELRYEKFRRIGRFAAA
jgi:acetyl-CoA carboxylase alpha subunit